MQIGDRIQPFELLSTEGKKVTRFDYADRYAFLIIVTCNHCKYAQAYWNRIIRLAKKYEDDSLGVIAICGNDANAYPQDSFENMKVLAQQLQLPFPYLHDPDQTMIKTLGATKTPEAFLFNRNRELVYRGAIDDHWENESAIMQVFLEDAIEYCLDGLEIDYPHSEPVGCSIKWLPGNEPV